MSSRLRNACLQYDWPGNLRELETFVKRHLVLGDEQLMIEDLRQDICAREPQAVVDRSRGYLRSFECLRRAPAKRAQGSGDQL